jgi:hypothetical protein
VRLYAQLVPRLDTLLQRLDALTSDVRSLAERVDTLGRRERQLRAVLLADATADDRILAFQTLLGGIDLEHHIKTSVQKAQLHLDPFPYCVVDRLFPKAYYNALLEAIPPVDLFADREVNKQQLTVPFEFAPKYSRMVWAHMTDVTAMTILAPFLIEKFRSPLTGWLRGNFPAIGDDPVRTMRMKCSDGRIMLRRPGYRIPPHRDPKWGFITCLLYLARPGDEPRWGTQLFRVDEDQDAQGASPHWISDEQCHWAADVDFLPNRALIFLNSVGAHGAEIPADAQPADLERYTYQFRIGPDRQSMESMRATLSEDAQSLWAGKVAAY